MDRTQEQRSEEVSKTTEETLLKMREFEGSRTDREDRAARMVLNSLIATIRIVDKSGIFSSEQSKKDIEISDVTRGYIAAYGEFIKENCK